MKEGHEIRFPIPLPTVAVVAGRLTSRVQLTSDGYAAYLEAVEGAFGADIDYAQLVKIYGAAPEAFKGCYSPSECIGARKLYAPEQ
jgi:hypothetical protein